jgi:hypothetical protein
MRFWGQITHEIEGACRGPLSARAFVPKARTHDPIPAPTRLYGSSFCRSTFKEFPLPVAPPAHQISQVMRFAKVKAEAAQRTGDTQQSASPG